jgi:uncharacterized protein YjbI with pentapeptide repeats
MKQAADAKFDVMACGAFLRRANLSGANLGGADLRPQRSKLRRGKPQRVELSDA